jgi:NDP-sugar pyrophosphorylase family protein
MKLHLIMPMGGKGSRFSEKGFDLPKPLIPINEKPFLYWSTKSISKFIDVEDITFVVLQEHIDKFEIDKVILQYFPDSKIVAITEVLNGAVLTCLKGLEIINDDLPILFNDCDHMFRCTSFEEYIRQYSYPYPVAKGLTVLDCDYAELFQAAVTLYRNGKPINLYYIAVHIPNK